MQTLGQIARNYGVSTQTLRNWKAAAESRLGRQISGQEHPADKRKVLYSQGEVDLITEGRALTHKTDTQEAPIPTEPTVVTGNHRSELAPPSIPQSVDLGCMRGTGRVQAYENPLEMIQAGMQLIDSVNGAMEQDLRNRISLYHQTEAATNELKRKAEDLERQQTRYQIESDLLGILQNQKTTELGDLMGKVQQLGAGSE